MRSFGDAGNKSEFLMTNLLDLGFLFFFLLNFFGGLYEAYLICVFFFYYFFFPRNGSHSSTKACGETPVGEIGAA